MIRESESELASLLKKQSVSLYRDRLRFILYLKQGICTSQEEVSKRLGIGLRQGQRNWRIYRERGIEGLLEVPQRGAPCKLTPVQVKELEDRLKDDDIATLEDAIGYLEQNYGVRYSTSGIFYVFERLKIKKKTGRPVYINKDIEGQEAFKKTLKP